MGFRIAIDVCFSVGFLVPIAILTFREVEPSPIVSVTQEQGNKKTMLS